jgi:hypothetical protein
VTLNKGNQMTATTDKTIWMTTEEAAEHINVKPQTLRAWKARGRCGKHLDGSERKPPKSHNQGGKVSYKRHDLDKWLEENSTN